MTELELIAVLIIFLIVGSAKGVTKNRQSLKDQRTIRLGLLLGVSFLVIGIVWYLVLRNR